MLIFCNILLEAYGLTFEMDVINQFNPIFSVSLGAIFALKKIFVFSWKNRITLKMVSCKA